MLLTILANGVIMFPKRGPPPRCPDGYDVDPQDPYVFHPSWEPCKYRYDRPYRCASGLMKVTPSCKLLGTDITFAQCNVCALAEPPPV